jgi:hypothetical protein
MRLLYQLCIGVLVCLIGLGVSFKSNAQQSTNNGLCWLDQGGQIDLARVADGCWFNGAKSLEFTVYKIGFCQSAPQPTTSAPLDLSACTVIYDNPSGQSVPISKSAAIPIVDTVPPDVGT